MTVITGWQINISYEWKRVVTWFLWCLVLLFRVVVTVSDMFSHHTFLMLSTNQQAPLKSKSLSTVCSESYNLQVNNFLFFTWQPHERQDSQLKNYYSVSRMPRKAVCLLYWAIPTSEVKKPDWYSAPTASSSSNVLADYTIKKQSLNNLCTWLQWEAITPTSTLQWQWLHVYSDKLKNWHTYLSTPMA